MDPFLEQDWLDVHSRLMTYICDQLQEQLPSELCARMESRVLVEDDASEEKRTRHPDVRVVETHGSGGTAVLERQQVAAIEPDMFLIEARAEPETERYIEIVDSQTRGRVITTIELISPSNKLPGRARDLFLTKREECLIAEVNVVEIDLTRGGERLSILPLGKIVPQPTYVGCVWRATRRDEIAVYVMPLNQPLKPMRIPLRATDEDVVLHLQPLVAHAYERGRYGNLDYSRPLYPPLSTDDAEFAAEVLKRAGKTS